MRAIVGVHGAGNYHANQTAAALSQAWTAALRRGYGTTLGQPEVAVAYYAPELRTGQSQGLVDPEHLPPDVRDAISVWARLAARGVGDGAQGAALRPLRAALGHVARTRTLDESVVTWFAMQLFREVTTYFHPAHAKRRAQAQRIVAHAIATNEPRVVIAHSLGSVVAWESLWAHPPRTPIDLFLTIGSPLALPQVVYDRLTPSPSQGLRGRPPGVRRWVNVADPGDLIAIPHPLSKYFDGIAAEFETAIGVFDFHRVKGYLACPTTGALVNSALGR